MNEIIELSKLLPEKELKDYNEVLKESSKSFKYYHSNEFELLSIKALGVSDNKLVDSLTYFLFVGGDIYFKEKEELEYAKLANDYQNLSEELDEIHILNTEIINAYSDQIDSLEDCILERSIPGHFIDQWFDLKKNVSKISRYYERFNLTIQLFLKKNAIKNEAAIASDILDEVNFNMGKTNSLLIKLDTLHHYYESIKDDKMNKSIYYLTLLSGIFLPLNLIVGFFGMNTENLIFKNHPQGTTYVLYILVGSAIIMALAFRSLKLIDEIFLKRLLGRYNFYKKLSSRIDDVEKSFDV